MNKPSAKQEALNIIQQLPDSVDTEEIMYQLYVLENIRRGQESATTEPLLSTEQVLSTLQSW